MRSARFVFTGCVCLMLPILAPAAEQKKLFDYRASTLPNGLKIVTLEDFSCPIVAVQLWFHVGSKDENPDRQGFAHMFEHMMFRGTDRLGPTEHFDLVRRTGGNCNAYTSFDQTVYVQKLPASQLELALWLEAERLGFLRIDQNAFDTERKVVEEERRLGLNRPYGTMLEKVLAEVFKAHPYGWSPIGKINHLRASAAQELRDFWARYYVPNNCTLVVVGAAKHEEVARLAERYFGWMPREAEPRRITVREPVQDKPRTLTIKEENAPTPLVGMVVRTPPPNHPDSLPLEILGRILWEGDSSRLYRALVADTQLSVGIQGSILKLEQEGFLLCGAALSPIGGDTAKVSQVLADQIKRVREAEVSEKELAKAKNQMLADIVKQNLTIESKAQALGNAAVILGDVEQVNLLPERIRKVTAADLKRVASTYLAPERTITIAIERNLLGSLMGRKAASAEENSPVTAKPETGPAPPAKPGLRRPAAMPAKPPLAPVVETKVDVPHTSHTLANGMKVLVIPNHEVPYINVSLGLKTGVWTESKPGTASMALNMLTRGTKKHDEKELAVELDTYAISLDGSAALDSARVDVGCLSDHLDRAMGLLKEVVEEPTFPAQEFDKLRKQVRTDLAISAAEPSFKADREVRRRLYGSHPYARLATGEAKDLDALKVEDCKDWWATFARPDQAVLIFAGDITDSQAMSLAQKTFGDWQGDKKPLPTLPAVRRLDQERKIYLVDQPGAVQSQIRVAQLGILRGDPKFPAAAVAGSYFGGAFNSRLNDVIRVKKGLTYGARGGFSSNRFSGTFAATTFTKTESTAKTLQAVLDEIDRFIREKPSEKELNDTKSYYLGSYAAGRETPQQIASELWTLELNDLPADFYERTMERVAKTDADACVKMLKETLDPAHLVIVVVGNASKLKAELEKIAPVVLVSPTENPDKVTR